MPQLPPGFRFGTATAAYSVEGGQVGDDGRGASIWDAFTAIPGRVLDGSDGSTAAGHYGRLDEDLLLLRDLGVGGYRFSISWPRVVPGGVGAPAPRGLDFYDRLVDGLLDHGIAPMATLYHWDLPAALEDDGGWLNRATVDAFVDYAALVGERLADRVTQWVPVAAPNIASLGGYGVGRHAPGRSLQFDFLAAAHHLLLAHGRGVVALRAAGATEVGCANNHSPMWPASDDPADVGATKLFDAVWNAMFLEPMLLGHYPRDLEPLLDGLVHDGDLSVVRQPLDFYGVDFYCPLRIAASGDDGFVEPDDDAAGEPASELDDEPSGMPFEFRALLGHEVTDVGWSVVPSALREWLVMVRARYRAALPPIVITECGAAWGGRDGESALDDDFRVRFLEEHLREVAAAAQRGVDVRGFYARSFLDGFEWAEGLAARYGLVHVNHETLVRTPKRSYAWYAKLISEQPVGLG